MALGLVELLAQLVQRLTRGNGWTVRTPRWRRNAGVQRHAREVLRNDHDDDPSAS